jgi:hypothetical protein
MSGGHLDEKLWMRQRPEIRRRAKAAILCEHFGAIEWKDVWRDDVPVYEPTGRLEPMWTMAYVSFSLFMVSIYTKLLAHYRSERHTEEQEILHKSYIDAFDGTPDWLRMAMVSPQKVGGIKYRWYVNCSNQISRNNFLQVRCWGQQSLGPKGSPSNTRVCILISL